MARLGAHLSTAGGLEMAARAAVEFGCETLQIFSGSPVTWASPPPPPESVSVFIETLAENDIRPVVVHAPYLVNLATADGTIGTKSRQALSTAVHRAEALGASYVV